MSALRIFALGGLGEVGMNCLVLVQRGEAILVDCGVTFDDGRRGVDVVHPDFSALDGLDATLRGVVVTHGHEDHIGALPYLLRRHDVPIWAPPYALGLIEERLGEHEVLEYATLHATRPRAPFSVGSFRIEPVRVTHSIADATALAIGTVAGTVIHTGDFKVDDDPPDGEHFDFERLGELGDAGVRLLMSDSTNVDSEGPTGGERPVGEALEAIVRESEGAVVVSLFASNVHRLRMLGEIAERTGRKLVALGRSVKTHERVAKGAGYLDWPDRLVVSDRRLKELPRRSILAIATGSQGEERAALARLARGEHPALTLEPGDAVVMSSRVIPGKEPEVQELMSALLRRGVTLHSRATDRGIHVSGHGHRPDQRRMIETTRPRSFLALHGTLHHLTRHAALAREAGVAETFAVENGQSLEVTAGAITLGPRFPVGRVHTWEGRPIDPEVLRERRHMGEDGVVAVHAVVTARGVLSDLYLDCSGVVGEAGRAATVEAMRTEIVRALDESPSRGDDATREAVRLAVRRAVHRMWGRKPVTLVTVARR